MLSSDHNGNLVAAIKKCGVFSTLTDVKIVELLPQFKHVKLTKGQVLFNQGDDSDFVYVVISGKLSAFFVSSKGIFKTIGTIEPPEPIGEFGALSGESRSLTIRADVETELVGLGCEDFKQLCQEFPTILLDTVKPIIARSLKTIKLFEEPQIQNEVEATAQLKKMTAEDRRLVAALKRMTVFGNVKHERIIQLLPHFKHLKLDAGKILFRQGEESDYIYIVVSGKLSAVLTTTRGEYRALGTVGPGETVGELGVLSGFARSLTIGVLEEVELIGLPSYIFRQLCQEYTSILLTTVDPIINRALQTIKLLQGEKLIENIVIFPACQNTDFVSFKKTFEVSVTQQKNMKLIHDNHMDPYDYIKLERASEKDGTKCHVFFLDAFEKIALHYLTEKVSRFYLVADAMKSVYTDETADQILKIIARFPHVTLYLILLYPDGTATPTTTSAWLTKKYNFSLHHHVRRNRNEDYQRLCRFMNGTAVGLVLGGGGTKGLAHIGVIRALLEKNIQIDAVGGTSIGALAGASYILNPQFNQMQKNFLWLLGKCYETLFLRFLVWPIVSLFSSSPITKAARKIFEKLKIEDLWIPFFCISSNLSTQAEVVHRKGLLWKALRASASLPGIVPPVVMHGQLHLDGGLLNNLPVDVMRNLLGPGCKIIASKLSSHQIDKTKYDFPTILTLKETLLVKLRISHKQYKFPPYRDMFLNSLLLGSSYKERQNSLAADLLINPDVTQYRTLSTTKKLEEKLIDMGYQEALKVIEESTSIIEEKQV